METLCGCSPGYARSQQRGRIINPSTGRQCIGEAHWIISLSAALGEESRNGHAVIFTSVICKGKDWAQPHHRTIAPNMVPVRYSALTTVFHMAQSRALLGSFCGPLKPAELGTQ